MIVVDTHVVVWLAEMPELLSAAAVEAIKEERRDGILAISDITLLGAMARIISWGKKVDEFASSLCNVSGAGGEKTLQSCP